MKVSIKDLVNSIKDKLSFSKVAMRILKLFESDDLSSYQLAKVIALDPVLAAYILKISNSAFYNFSGKVKTLSDAITLIGFEEIKKIVIMISAKNAFKVSDEIDKMLWEHSLAVAVGCSVINSMVNVAEEGEAYISGLLHDIGKIVYKKSELVNYKDIFKKAYDTGEEIRFLEEKEFGYNHADVGGYLLQNWNFEQGIVDAVSFHHLNFTIKKTSDFLKKSALVNLSDFIVNDIIGVGKKETIKDVDVINDLNSARLIGFYTDNPIALVEEIQQKFMILASTMEEET